MFLFRSQLHGGLPLTVFRFRKELAYFFEASLQHLIKDGSRTSPCLCGLGVRVSALWLAHASPRLTPVLARIMDPPKVGGQFRDGAERLMTGL
jgi:hypothetical protein